jgi:hypothetical protein
LAQTADLAFGFQQDTIKLAAQLAEARDFDEEDWWNGGAVNPANNIIAYKPENSRGD